MERESRFVTLVGVPGIGKSRLVWELSETIGRGRARVLEAGTFAAVRTGGQLPGDRRDGESPGRYLEDDTAEVVGEKLGRAVHGVVDVELDWVEARLRPLVGETELDAGASNRDESFTAWRTFFEALAERRPSCSSSKISTGQTKACWTSSIT